MMPGQFEAFAHRKAFCERQVRETIAAGANHRMMTYRAFAMCDIFYPSKKEVKNGRYF